MCCKLTFSDDEVNGAFCPSVKPHDLLQALVNDIQPPTTVVTGYAIGLKTVN